MRFKNRIAVVTGGGSGIGAAVATQLASEGATVCLLSEKPVAVTDAVTNRLCSAGYQAFSYQCDVTDSVAVGRTIEQITQTHANIDVLINCAGIFIYDAIEETSDEALRQVLEVNFEGTYRMIRAALPVMRRQGRGAIVNISSEAAVFSPSCFSAYAGSKGAIISITKGLVPELAKSGIRINAVLPGAVRTPMVAAAHTPVTPEGVAFLEYLEATSLSPFGEVYMPPEDIAEVVVFLASDAARGIQGAAIPVTHGMGAAQASPQLPK